MGIWVVYVFESPLYLNKIVLDLSDECVAKGTKLGREGSTDVLARRMPPP